MLVYLKHWLHTSTIEIHSSYDSLKDITEDFCRLKKLYITIIDLKIFVEAVKDIFVYFPFHSFLLSFFLKPPLSLNSLFNLTFRG